MRTGLPRGFRELESKLQNYLGMWALSYLVQLHVKHANIGESWACPLRKLMIE